MKKLVFILALMLTITVSVSGMNSQKARSLAFFLTDKMAYELNLTQEQYDAAYEINYDYLLSINGSRSLYNISWNRRNIDLEYILGNVKFAIFKNSLYFYRPVYWKNNKYNYRIYSRYTNYKKFYFSNPSGYSNYNGRHSWKANNNRSYYKGKNFGSGNGMRDGLKNNSRKSTGSNVRNSHNNGNGNMRQNGSSSRNMNSGNSQNSNGKNSSNHSNMRKNGASSQNLNSNNSNRQDSKGNLKKSSNHSHTNVSESNNDFGGQR